MEHLTFSQFQELMEDSGPEFPSTMYLKRQAVRQYPSGLVAVYKDFATGFLLSIPAQWIRK